MDAVHTIPVTIDPEAVERVAELGMQADLERMLEHTRQLIPDAVRIHVEFMPPYDTGPEPYINIHAIRTGPWQEALALNRAWRDWKMKTFSTDVYRHFALFIYPEGPDAG